MTRLTLASLELAANARRPAYDPARLAPGIVHLGVGAFHRAHQAVFTEDAIEAAGGGWGVIGVCPRRADIARALAPQDGLYTLELRSAAPPYRIVGALRRVITAVLDHRAALDAVSAPEIHIATVTVTEPAYALGSDGELDLDHPNVRRDIAHPQAPLSTPGWLLEALARRRAAGAGPISVLSCDNLRDNSARLGRSIMTLAQRRDPELAAWIAGQVAFPNTMVDAITPGSDARLEARVALALGLEDRAPVQREPFAQWVIQDHFAGPRPAWERAGAEIVGDVAAHEALKLHVLNAAHSALAYLGPARGHALVREAIADPVMGGFLDAMMAEEVAPALPGHDVAGYWRTTRARLAQPAMDHRLDQIARDGAAKLRERIHPLIVAAARAGRPAGRLASVVRAWLALERRQPAAAMDDPALFSEPFRYECAVREAVMGPAA